MKKKIWIICIVILLLFVILGYDIFNYCTRIVTLINISNVSIIVKDEEEIIEIQLNKLNKSPDIDLTVGTDYKIIYRGRIVETYPSSIKGRVFIKKYR